MLAPSDLESAAWCGLLEAWRRGDRTGEGRMDALLEQRARGAMRDELRRADTVSRRQRRVLRAAHQAEVRALARTGARASARERAEAAGLSVARLQEVEARAAERKVESLDALEVELGAAGSDVESLVEQKQEHDRLRRAVSSLPERHRAVVGMYYQQEQTMREIAGTLGVSETRACQLHARALELLRVALAA